MRQHPNYERHKLQQRRDRQRLPQFGEECPDVLRAELQKHQWLQCSAERYLLLPTSKELRYWIFVGILILSPFGFLLSSFCLVRL